MQVAQCMTGVCPARANDLYLLMQGRLKGSSLEHEHEVIEA